MEKITAAVNDRLNGFALCWEKWVQYVTPRSESDTIPLSPPDGSVLDGYKDTVYTYILRLCDYVVLICKHN